MCDHTAPPGIYNYLGASDLLVNRSLSYLASWLVSQTNMIEHAKFYLKRIICVVSELRCAEVSIFETTLPSPFRYALQRYTAGDSGHGVPGLQGYCCHSEPGHNEPKSKLLLMISRYYRYYAHYHNRLPAWTIMRITLVHTASSLLHARLVTATARLFCFGPYQGHCRR